MAGVGRKKLNRRARIAKAKAAKRDMRDRMRAAGLTTGTRSLYQQKIARKRGGGAVAAGGMWWLERGE